MTEGITTEFKREYTDEIKKTVIACPYYLAANGLRPEGGLCPAGGVYRPGHRERHFENDRGDGRR